MAKRFRRGKFIGRSKVGLRALYNKAWSNPGAGGAMRAAWANVKRNDMRTALNLAVIAGKKMGYASAKYGR